MTFATYQLNVAPECGSGFKPEMSWEGLIAFLEDLFIEEVNTPEGQNVPLHYVKKDSLIIDLMGGQLWL